MVKIIHGAFTILHFIGCLFMNENEMLMSFHDVLEYVGLDVISANSLTFIFLLRSYAHDGLILRLAFLMSQDHALTLRRPFAYLVISSFISIRIDLLAQ